MKDGTIKGKWNLIYGAYLFLVGYDVGANMKYRSTIAFTGIRSTGADIPELDPDQAQDLPVRAFKTSLPRRSLTGSRKP